VRFMAGMTALVLAVAARAEAHPGHGAEGGAWTVQHYASEPLHLGTAAVMAAVAAAVVAWRVRDGRRARPAPARRAPRVL
jgi:hypothetical protein